MLTAFAAATFLVIACAPGDRTTTANDPPPPVENKPKAGATECTRNSCKEETKNKCCTNGSQTWCCASNQDCDITPAGCK